MSAHDSVSKKKQKKAERDAERQKKGKKRKRQEVEEGGDQTQHDELQQDFIPLEGGLAVIDTVGDGAGAIDNAQNGDAAVQKISKGKKRKVKHTSSAPGEDTTADASSNGKKHRFILFIGNLPYSATDASINEHFKKLAPFNLRHRTDPKTKKSKGFAFLEFENFDRLKTCIKLYHHSVFGPANSDADAGGSGVGRRKKDKGGRRINVELTAGGGGSKAGRKEKIKAKNVRLEEQRKRQLEEQWKEREKERAKKAGEGVDGAGTAARPKKPTKQVAVVDDTAAMHPSRAARLAK